ncbi:hypothetical protein GP486_006128 [Trichoglossum hirsutum]|uniref:non-specific serine/threonine protein kinase n=1 Tax=Trichoglossum hirsutum TaxID=265104 RepID=A0A9P8L7X6_9PEZI|nr:hypothetical protein GP486_006128 [Trichoglossum hirsutum]
MEIQQDQVVCIGGEDENVFCWAGIILKAYYLGSQTKFCSEIEEKIYAEIQQNQRDQFASELAAYTRLQEKRLDGEVAPSLLGRTTLWDLPSRVRTEMEKPNSGHCKVLFPDRRSRGDCPILILDSIEGDSLWDLDTAECDEIQRKLEKILGRLHHIGIAHGDIRESNVLWMEDDKFMLIDFRKAVIHDCEHDDPRWELSMQEDYAQLGRMFERLRNLAWIKEKERNFKRGLLGVSFCSELERQFEGDHLMLLDDPECGASEDLAGTKGGYVLKELKERLDSITLRGVNVAQCNHVQRQLKETLEWLHGMGIAHGNIRESNVFRLQNDEVMLVHFKNAVIRRGEHDWRWLSAQLEDRIQLRKMMDRLRNLARLEKTEIEPKVDLLTTAIRYTNVDDRSHLEASELFLCEHIYSYPPIPRIERLKSLTLLAFVRWKLGGRNHHDILSTALAEAAEVEKEARYPEMGGIISGLAFAKAMFQETHWPSLEVHEAVGLCARHLGADHDLTLRAQLMLASRLGIIWPDEAEEWLLNVLYHCKGKPHHEEILFNCLSMLSHVYCEVYRPLLIPLLYKGEIDGLRMTSKRLQKLVGPPRHYEKDRRTVGVRLMMRMTTRELPI